MSNEITINASMVYEDVDGVTQSISITDKLVTVTTKQPMKYRQLVTTGGDDIILGEIGSIGWMMLKNLDPVNSVEVRTAAAGLQIGKMLAGESYGPVRVGAGIPAPGMAAVGGSCWVEVLICAT